ncbi:hybrid sensor histidine kinase/response regulator [Streptomyces bluensis]|uniref:hybrid sensor histidine kinase/response regulator n=1 Tax=Streptomyces bluensis TaxID=33897 RepID=UPI0033175C6F
MSSRPSRGAARLAAILDALPDALVLVNANGTVVNANTIALEAFETPGTALVGRGLLDLLPEFDSRLIPGSMRRPDSIDPHGRTKPTRMIARRTDGSEFPVEVTSANLENGQQAYDGYGYTGDELLMLVVRDLSGTVDTEAELARAQRQTEMILRAASEGVVGTDTDGRIVLVNPAAAQILGYRASDLGGRELHTLVLHSREDGSPFPYAESPLADTLRSGRKHRVRGQVLWSKSGNKVPVDLTTAPVRDGDQLVGAVMTFTDRRPYDALAEEKQTETAKHAEEIEKLAAEHAEELGKLREEHAGELDELRERHAEELAAGDERYAALGERAKDRYEALAARHEQLLAVLGHSLRGPLEQLRGELGKLAADDAGQLWPEANQVLHHLTAGYSRITTLVDNVLGYQHLDSGDDDLVRTAVMLDAVVAAGVDGAVELIGPGRVQFAVHAPPIEAEVDQRRLAIALAHLIADVAGVDATGNSPVTTGGYMDNTVVVAAAQRGEVVRIEVRGPYAGGDPVHQPIVGGIVRAHGGVLQTHEVPGMSGSAYVLEVPIGGGAGAVPAQQQPAVDAAAAAVAEGAGTDGVGADGAGGVGAGTVGAEVALPEEAAGSAQGNASRRGRRRAHRSSVDAFLDGEESEAEAAAPTGRRRRRAESADGEPAPVPAPGEGSEEASVDSGAGSGGTGRRRGRPSPAENSAQGVAEGAVVTAAEHAAGAAATGLGETVPPQGVPAPAGRRARRNTEQHALPPALPAAPSAPGPSDAGAAGAGAGAAGGQPQPTGRRRRALANAEERAAAPQGTPGRAVFALPPAAADRTPEYEAAHGAAAAGLVSGAGGPAAPMPPGAPVVPAQAAGQVPALGPAVDAGVGAGVGAGQVAAEVPGVPGAGVPPAGAGAVAVPGGTSGAGMPGGPQAGHGRHDAAPHDPSDDHTPPQPHPLPAPTGRRRARRAPEQGEAALAPAQGIPAQMPSAQGAVPGQATAAAAQGIQASGGGGQAVPAQGVPGQQPVPPQGVARQQPVPPQGVPAPAAQPVPARGVTAPAQQPVPGPGVPGPAQPVPAQGTPGGSPQPVPAQGVQGVTVPAQLPIQIAPNSAAPVQGAPGAPAPGHSVPAQHVPAQPARGPQPAQAAPAGAGSVPPNVQPQPPAGPAPQSWPGVQGTPPPGTPVQAGSQPWPGADDTSGAGMPAPAARPVQPGAPAQPGVPAQASSPAPAEQITPSASAPGTPLPPERPQQPSQAQTQGQAQAQAQGQAQARVAQPLPAEAATPVDPNSTQGRAISVRTLGQGVPFARQPQPGAAPTPAPHQSNGSGTNVSGRRRKLGTPPEPAARPEAAGHPHPQGPGQAQAAAPAPAAQAPAQAPVPSQPSLAGQAPLPAQPSLAGQSRLDGVTDGAGRSYAIGAPDENADEGPEPLDGPGGAVEVSDQPQPRPMDDELPPEPLDNPRRLLVWPAPDVTTQQALSDRGYRPVIVNSREEVDAQIAAFPAALFVDPLTGPITRTALQSLRQAAVAAEVPVLVTAGLGQASRDAAYGADPAVLLKALAPRDSEQHPPRVLLIEQHAEIALALTATLERRGMQVARAASDADAVTLAAQMRPNLVVMDLLQVRRRHAGIVDWLRANGQLNRTPLVVYTAAVDQAELPRLASGETVLFLAERSTSPEVQDRIVDLLARIGTN